MKQHGHLWRSCCWMPIRATVTRSNAQTSSTHRQTHTAHVHVLSLSPLLSEGFNSLSPPKKPHTRDRQRSGSLGCGAAVVRLLADCVMLLTNELAGSQCDMTTKTTTPPPSQPIRPLCAFDPLSSLMVSPPLNAQQAVTF